MPELRVVDACAFHEWASPRDLVPYMSPQWGAWVDGGTGEGTMGVQSRWRYAHPRGAKAAVAYPPSGAAPGSDRAFLADALFAGGKRDRVVLGFHDGLLATSYPLPHVARETVRAANDWTIAEWLEHDSRLFGHVLVSTALPDEAAAEIRRVGSHEQMVAVALGMNGLAKGFGHPAYLPIIEAAAELGLPLVLQAGSESTTDSITLPTAAGLPSTFAEHNVLAAQGLMSHVSSLILGGTFELHPDLRVLLVGGGAAWVPWFLWNLDWGFKFMRRIEAPWLRSAPSDYFLRHVRLTTYSLEAPRQAGRLGQLLGTMPGASSMLLYASGYPNWDFEGPEAIAERLPEDWHENVFRENALEFYRWPSGERVTADAEAAVVL
jgi:predicted TIM-barrel fold metal-dependent hydrolase